MNQAAHSIGRTLALVLPIVLVLSGTLAVTRVPWAAAPSESQVLTASAQKASSPATSSAPQDVLRDRLITELWEKDPGAALTSLQKEVTERPSLATYCTAIARALGRAAVAAYGAQRAQSYARPVCDVAFASGISQAG